MTFYKALKKRRSPAASQGAFRPSCAFLLLASITIFGYGVSFGAQTPDALKEVQRLETSSGTVLVREAITPEQASSFEPFTLTVEIQKPQDVVPSPNDLSGDYGDFSVEYLGDEERELDESRNAILRRWTLYPKRRGELELPPIPITILPVDASDAESTDSVVALLPRQTLTIPETDAPVKSVDSIEPNLAPIRQTPLLAIVATLLVIGVLALILRSVKAKKGVAVPNSGEPEEPPFDKAIRKLDELKESANYLENKPQFYVDVDEILREYLTKAFAIDAQGTTTQEFFKLVKERRVPDSLRSSGTTVELVSEPSELEEKQLALAVLAEPEIHAALESALTSLELVKFAKRPTTFNDASRLYAQTREVTERSYSLYTSRLEELRKELAARENVAENEQNPPSDQSTPPDPQAQ